MPRRRASSERNNTTPPKRRRYNLRDTAARRQHKLANELEGRTNTLTDEEFRNKISVIKEKKKPGKALKIESIDTLTYANRKAHHTYDYDQEDTILRRGQEFTISVTFDRDVDVNNDRITLQFVYGNRPKESKGTIIRIPLNIKEQKPDTDIGQCWQVETEKKTSTVLLCKITSPPDCCIGNYELFVETQVTNGATENRLKYPGRIIIIFNPWCKDDSVYMENPEWRDEYVMNDTGRIWVGSKYRNFGRPWVFGQFDEPVLDAVQYLLDESELADEARNSPVSVLRTLSAYINSMDDNGMLEGRWTAEYPDDCTKPTSWTGSVPIIKEYLEKKEPVRYGQCWVFSGLTTSLCRAIGIPTRSVTNFESAHDTDCSMTIDRHYNEDGEPLDDLDDSTWNFHVWNECWFKRYDLPEGYDGWQAVDSTPQELSEGIMRCGPAPLTAIKEGHVYLNYDVGFIFSEVNGDKIVWQVNEKDDTMKVMQVDRHSVGWNISTKAVGSDLVDILDNQYKYPEGSEKERQVVRFVNRFSTRRKNNIYKLDTKRDINFKLVLPENAFVCEDFVIYADVKNNFDEKKSFVFKATLVSSYYTGLAGNHVKTIRFEEQLDAGKEKRLCFPVSYKEYGARMNPEGRFQVFVTGMTDGKMNAIEESFVLRKPEITITVTSDVEYGEETKAIVCFKNTTLIKMTKCFFHVESPGVLDAVTFTNEKPLLPGQEWTEHVLLKPRRRYRRQREIVAEFSCKELVGVEGIQAFKVVNNCSDDD